jgi:hypothetical protein
VSEYKAEEVSTELKTGINLKRVVLMFGFPSALSAADDGYESGYKEKGGYDPPC